MTRNRIPLLGLLLISAFLAEAAFAETVYVTDKLRLGLYAERGASGQRLELLNSGDPLELLQRDGNFARVRTQDGTTGWVKFAFLVEEKPAALRVFELEKGNRDLTDRVATLTEELSQSQASLKETQTGLTEAQASIEELKAELSIYTGTERSLFQKLIDDPLLLAFAILLMIIGLAAGGLTGYLYYDRRVRRRFSGFRLDTP